MSESKDKKEKVCIHYQGNSWGYCGHPVNAGHICQESRIGCTNAEETCRGFKTGSAPKVETKKKSTKKRKNS